MKTKKTLWLFGLIISIFHPSYGQQLEKYANMFHTDDRIEKLQVRYTSPGRSGDHVLWDISEMSIENEGYLVRFSKRGTDSIACVEHQTSYLFKNTSDTLFLYGFENNQTRIMYDSPIAALHFPMSYGDSIMGVYHGSGVYCEKNYFRVMGEYKSKIDSYGTLILSEGDTLFNVCRLRMERTVIELHLPEICSEEMLKKMTDTVSVFTKDSVLKYVESNPNVLKAETFQWYAPGYRYPIYETLRVFDLNNPAKENFSTAFYYAPDKQEISEGDESDAYRYLEEKRNRNNTNIRDAFTYNIIIDKSCNMLTLNCLLQKESQISIQLYSGTGILLWQRRDDAMSPGAFSEHINVQHSQGVCLLHIIVDGESYTSKVVLNR